MQKLLAITVASIMTLFSVSAIPIRLADHSADSVQDQPFSHRRVLVIGIDGCRTDAFMRAHTPHIDALIETGVFCPNTDIVGPRETGADTVSGPGWTSILTGVWADKHGVRDNSFRGARLSQYPHLFHRIRAVRPHAQMLSISSWEPIHENIVRSRFVSIDYSQGDSFETADMATVETACQTLRTRDTDVLFVYLGNVDSTGHNRGFHPAVKPYMNAIEQADAQIGRLIATLRSRPHFDKEDWLIVVCTDHGGRGMGHQRGHRYPEVRRVFTVYNSPQLIPTRIEGPTYLVDIAPTIVQHLGLYIPAEWNWDGRPIARRAVKTTQHAESR